MLQIRYIRVSFARSVLFFAIGLALVALSCGGDGEEKHPDGGSAGMVDGEYPFDSMGEALQSTPGIDDLGIENVIKIEYKNGAVEINNPYSEEVSIEENGQNVVVRISDDAVMLYNFILSGTTSNGSLKFYGDVRKGLYLNGLNITSSAGPAINIQKKSKRVIVHLVSGTKNFLTDSKVYNTPEGEQAKGTFFSEGKLEFEGSGSLEVKAKHNHAIVVDNDFEMNNGEIIISESVNDGIHANDKINVNGGFLKIISAGDAIQSERRAGSVTVTGGKVKILTTGIKSHGIASDSGAVLISDGLIQISTLGNGAKGIRSRNNVFFLGGKTLIKTSGTKHTDPADPADESNSAGIKLASDLLIDDGILNIKTLGNGAKGINVDGDATIKNVELDIEADDDGLRVHGTLSIQNSSGSIKSKKKKAINAETWNNNTGGITTQDSGGS